MKKLLLHTCCAPCASGCIERLVAEEREVTLYFSNSNINAAEEFEKRLETVCKFAKAFQLEVLVDDYDHALKYNYKEEHVKGIVDTMWSSNYNAIANCNYLLQNIEKKGSVMSERLRNVVEGEALALRAFLHFDLLRGYAPSYKMGKDEPAIPYPEFLSDLHDRIFV